MTHKAARTARVLWLVLLCVCSATQAVETLPDTQALTLQGDLSAQMVAGIDRYLTRQNEQALPARQYLT